jgi:hypothetical protein
MYNSLSQSQSGQFNASGFHLESHSQSFSQSHSQSSQSQSQSFSRTSSTFSSGGSNGSISGGWGDGHSTPRSGSTAPSSPQPLPQPPVPANSVPWVEDLPPVDNHPPGTNSDASLWDDAPPVIPKNHTNRTLVLCFDGTGDQFDDDVSCFRT